MAHHVSLDDLIALNDEIAGLARAGIPLDEGLLQLGGDVPGRLGGIVRQLAQRLDAGQPLEVALADEPGLPPVYRAVVVAGVRAGRLTVALEGLAGLLRRAADLRRTIVTALIYPVIVLLVAMVLFNFTVLKVLPAMDHVFRELVPGGHAVRSLAWVTTAAGVGLPWLPLAALAVPVVLWLRSRRVWSFAARRPAAAADTGRSIGGVLRAGRVATLADTLALLLQQAVPLPDALVLSGDASGDADLSASCRHLADRLGRGEAVAGLRLPGLPPLLAWLLTDVRDQSRLVAGLQRSAESYRRRAARSLRWLSVYVPFWLTVALGGTLVTLYALSIFWPWSRLLYEMSLPIP